MAHFRPAFVLIVLFTVLTGVVFPGAFTGVAAGFAPGLANGSIVERNGVVVGSALIGQNFVGETYFHPRPSATTDTDPADASKTVASPYNASSSGGSNAGPTSKALIERVTGDLKGAGAVPGDAVTTSASGLDPDISPTNAEAQVARVAGARKLSEAQVRGLVAAQTGGRLLGVFGEPRVNVLALNLALDGVKAQ